MRQFTLPLLMSGVLVGGVALVAWDATRAESRSFATSAAAEQIAVSTTRGSIILIDMRGRRLATLTKPQHPVRRCEPTPFPCRMDWDPAWSPDGTRIAFARTTDGRRSSHVYVMRADGSGVRRITNGLWEESPSWSPDGRWIAYQSADGIRLVHPWGGATRRIPKTGEIRPGCSTPFASNPAWTTDGRLAYSFHPEDPSDWPAACKRRSSRCGWIVTVRLDGSSQLPIVRGRDAHWSRDGQLIVYTPPDGGVATVSTRGGRGRFLGKGYEADWSADGQSIVFARLGWSTIGDSIWLMKRDGSGRRRILAGATAPAWRPRATSLQAVRP